MWNIKDDVTGWNLNKERPPKTECNYCKEGYKCSYGTLFHCDYRKDGICHQPYINPMAIKE